MKALSNLAQSVRASTTLAIDTQFNKMRSEGIDVIGFSVGQPDFPTPEHIKQAGIRAIQENLTKYTPTPGTPGWTPTGAWTTPRRRSLSAAAASPSSMSPSRLSSTPATR